MPRRLRVATRELGPLELFVIYETGGELEPTWRPLQGTGIISVLTVLSKEAYDHALVGWSKPLVTALGLEPKGALRKLPVKARQCEVRASCPFYDKHNCIPTSPKLPWCFEADVSDDPEIRRLTSEVIRFWRDGVYVVIVRD